jgi:hypothetical protein
MYGLVFAAKPLQGSGSGGGSHLKMALLSPNFCGHAAMTNVP